MQSRERFLKAVRCEAVDRPPVWLMRQAGRYLPEYQAIREKHPFLEMATDPNLIAEISLQPWRRFQMDGVIVFSDILIPPRAMGLNLRFEKGEGPVFGNPIRSKKDVEALRPINPKKDIPFLLEGLRKIKKEIKEDAALIGFAGAPWTTASYMVEGQGKNGFPIFKSWIKKEPVLLKNLLQALTDSIGDYAEAQIDAGADVIQFFDSWGGLLSAQEYAAWSAPYLKQLVDRVRRKSVPAILFVKDSAPLLQAMKQVDADVFSIGEETSLSEARRIFGTQKAVQGNLSPNLLLEGSKSEVISATEALLQNNKNEIGFIVNLGHGILPKTPVDNVSALIETVRHGGV